MVAFFYYFKQKDYIFFPTKTYTPPPSHLNIEEVFIDTEDGEKLHAWWLANNEADKTVLFCHGNGGNLTDRDFRLGIFDSLKVNALIFDYRSYGKSSGEIRKEEDLYTDVKAAWNYLAVNKSIPPEKIIVWGRSLGGAMALDVAQGKNVAAVIVEATFFSADDIAKEYYWYLPHKLLLRYHFRGGEKIQNVKAPILIVHSKEDEMIPYRQGEKLFEVAPEPKELFTIKGSHNTDTVVSYQEYFFKVKTFLEL